MHKTIQNYCPNLVIKKKKTDIFCYFLKAEIPYSGIKISIFFWFVARDVAELLKIWFNLYLNLSLMNLCQYYRI